jgi:hypothetical protein
VCPQQSIESSTALVVQGRVAGFGVGAAHRDGECGNAYRDTTPAERATAAHVLETIRSASPASLQAALAALLK